MTSPYVSFEAKVLDKNKRNISPTRNNANSTHTFSPIKSGSRPVTARSERDPPSEYFSFCLTLGCNTEFHSQEEVVAIFYIRLTLSIILDQSALTLHERFC